MACRARLIASVKLLGQRSLFIDQRGASLLSNLEAPTTRLLFPTPATTSSAASSSSFALLPPLGARAFSASGMPFPAAEDEEGHDIKPSPASSPAKSFASSSASAAPAAVVSTLGRAPTAATAAFAAASSGASSACDRIDLATKLLDADHAMSAPTYTREYLESVRPTHLEPRTLRQRLAHRAIQLVRGAFDTVTRYDPDGPNPESRWLRRMLFLETVAGVPGMVGGALRHLRSLRLLRFDGGRINTLLDESENERMHLMTFMELRRPGPLFRAAVVAAQGIMWNAYFLLYLASPNTAHAVVGFLEEEAVKTYTHALAEIDAGRLWPVDGPVKPPAIAIRYWQLPEDATMRDVILAIRADEAAHAHVNHTFSEIDVDAPNPFAAAAHAGASMAAAAEMEVEAAAAAAATESSSKKAD